MVLASWITPDLSAVQNDHKTAIPHNSEFNDSAAPGEFFLFTDSRFSQELDSTNIYNGDYRDLRNEFDGYALFTKMQYIYTEDQANETISRGLFFGIPVTGITGWLCTTEQASSTEVTSNCVSRFMSSSDYLHEKDSTATDLTVA